MHLEDGARVVVEPPHELVVEPVGDAERVQIAHQLLPVGLRLGAEVVGALGRVPHERLARELLGVEQAQRVALEAAPVVGAEVRQVRPEVLPQRLDVRGAVGRVPDVVQHERHATEPEAREHAHGELDHLEVDRRRGVADGLGAELVELPVAPRLWTVVAEHGRQVVEPHGLGLVVQPVLEVGTADGGGALGAQRHLLPTAVLEAVHLLRDDVRLLPDGPREETGIFEEGRVDAAVAGGLRGRGGDGGDVGPVALVLGQDVGGAAGGLVHDGMPLARARGRVAWARQRPL